MTQDSLPSADWYKAITLTERVDSLRAVQGPKLGVGVNRDLAEQRLER